MTMGRYKKYSGYKAYQYLEPKIDYAEVRLRDEIEKDWSYVFPLSKAEEERFEGIVEKSVFVDLHEHPVVYPEDVYAVRRNEGREFMAYDV